MFTLLEGLRDLKVAVWNSNTLYTDDFLLLTDQQLHVKFKEVEVIGFKMWLSKESTTMSSVQGAFIGSLMGTLCPEAMVFDVMSFSLFMVNTQESRLKRVGKE